MKLSLAIINDNEALYLKRFFESLGNWKDSLDIVFVDNCSCDNSIQIVKDLRIRKIVTFEKGVSRPVLYNAAASRTEGEYVLFTHSDIIFSDGFFKNLEKGLKERTDLDFMNFRVMYVDKTTIAPSIVYWDFKDKRIKLSYQSIWGISDPALKKLTSCSESCFLVDSTVFKHEHFDERYFDTLFIEDLLLKLDLQGANIVYDEDSYIEHYFLEEHKRLRTLKYDIRLFIKNNLKELQAVNLVEQDRQISSLETNLQEKVAQIDSLEFQIDSLEFQIDSLEFQIQQIQQTIPIQLVNRYQRVIEKLLRPGTHRHHYYELGLSGIRVILNEGWKSFFRKAQARLAHRTAAIKRPRHDLPKFNNSISEKEADKLVFPVPSDKPEVSIVIPAYNNWKYTLNCLKLILGNTDGDYEVVAIDDASTDATAEVLSKVKNLYLVTNKQNEGFIESCNRGARASKGKYILFLNNDTMVTKGWLPSLLELIRREDVGAVGSKLVYPDGTLQEAGSIVWRDGSAFGYGRDDDSSKPEYNYVREVDYCSGASLMVKGELFEKIGGLDERFKPSYYEDVDLCFAIRNLGYRVMYQPMSVIVHLEGVTCGTHIHAGIKKYQEINKPKFVKKWKTILDKRDYYESYKNIFSSRNRLPGKSILILDDRIPNPAQGSGYPRAYRLVKFVSELGYRVTLFPLANATPWQPYTNELQQLSIEVFYGGNLNLSQFAKDRDDCYDLVLVSRPHNMKKTFDIMKRFFPSAALLYDAEAIFSMREVLKARVRGDERMEKVAEGMMNQELNLVKKADLIITVSENERKVIAEKTGLNNVTVWGHPIEVKEPQTPFNQRKDILFVGGFLGLDSPNEDAIVYFAKEVFPKVEPELSCRLFIVGMNPPNALRKLSSPSVIVTGYIEDLREYYEKCRLFVVPHRYSAGIPLKLLEAMGYGIPSIVSKLTAAQLNLTDSKEVLVAGNAGEFAAKTMKLYKNSELWYQLQQNSLNYIRETCNMETLKTKLNDIIESGLKYQAESLRASQKSPLQQTG